MIESNEVDEKLEILYSDKHFVAINKPHGLLVHKTKLAADEDVAALQLLRDQLNQYVYPVHRLDRKTSGVLLFALDKEVTKLLQAELAKDITSKTYYAICRGHFPKETIECDKILHNEKGVGQESKTFFTHIQSVELPIPFGKFETSRYSFIECKPKTGRMHQIRKHLNHLRYPIIGDRPHGCNKQNKLFLEKWNMSTMLLHHRKLDIIHPITGAQLSIQAAFQPEYKRIAEVLNINLI